MSYTLGNLCVDLTMVESREKTFELEVEIAGPVGMEEVDVFVSTLQSLARLS